MTVTMYARRKKLPLDGIVVRLRHSRIHAEDCFECQTEEGFLDRIDREIELSGSLSPDDRLRLFEIAEKCPVSRTLTSEINIRSVLA
jgi:putative redox protein